MVLFVVDTVNSDVGGGLGRAAANADLPRHLQRQDKRQAANNASSVIGENVLADHEMGRHLPCNVIGAGTYTCSSLFTHYGKESINVVH